ncbi:MAG: glycosyltransferase family 2 protein [Planctomycetes bacterium]|nr:glycosyltransferase family 2 protein [Planctomycetota bacterium]
MIINPKVYILILNWNGWKDTLECLESLKGVNYPDCQIVVVDNGSTDESVERIDAWVKSHAEIKALLLKTGRNTGFAGGNNFGIKYILEQKDCGYVLLLNNDTVVEKDFLFKMVETARANPDAGIVGGRIAYYANRGENWYAGGRISFWRGCVYVDKKIASEEPFATGFITGCLMLIKPEVFLKAGFLEEEYFLGVEDWEFCLKAGREYKLMVDPRAVIYHKVSAATGGENSPLTVYYTARNRMMFINRNLRGLQRMSAFTYTIITRLVKIPLYFMRFKFRHGWAMFKGLAGINSKRINN